MNNETIESVPPVESKDSSVETVKPVELKEPEINEEHIAQGAHLLESPQDGSFMHGLQAFVTWVNNLLAGKK
ncbi:MAG TPA: hypothetical protein VGQ87_01025 [Patescibacteria group bacterium]|jgi:hypothetical protein|nr:hypothetical protein [Patescibacteria group bacterium]